MKNFLAFLAALVIVVAGLGWYLGWYRVSSTPLAGGHKKVSVDVNANKVQSDVKKGSEVVIEKGKQIVEEVSDKAAEEAAKKTKEAVKGEVNKFDPFKLPGAQEESSEPVRRQSGTGMPPP